MRKQWLVLGITLFLVSELIYAQPVQEFVPLKNGNFWHMKSSYDSSPVRLAVESVMQLTSKRRAKLVFHNPWSTYTLIVSATEQSLVLEGLETSTYSLLFDSPAELFTTSRPLGSSWDTPLGPVKYASTGLSLSTPYGVIDGVDLFLLGDQYWYIKSGFGFIQFGEGFTGYQLNEAVGEHYVIPAPLKTRPSSCPLLGYDISPTSSQLNEEQRIQTATSQGLKFTHLSLRWTDIEKTPSTYDLSEIQKWVRYTNLYNFDLAFTIRIVDTSTTWLPSDLAGKPLTDPVVQQRLEQLFHRVLPLMNSRMKWINISNEVDLFVYMYPGRQDEVINFLSSTRSLVKQLKPDLSTGAVISFGTALNSDPFLKKIDPLLDHLSATYYPLRSTFAPRPPAEATGDIRLLSALTQKPIILTEVGYPSSPGVESSPQKQGEFYQTVIEALRNEGSHFIGINFFQHADMPPPTVSYLAAFYYSEEIANRYRSFLSSLGMKTFEGQTKPAWNQFMTGFQAFNQANGCFRPVE